MQARQNTCWHIDDTGFTNTWSLVWWSGKRCRVLCDLAAFGGDVFFKHPEAVCNKSHQSSASWLKVSHHFYRVCRLYSPASAQMTHRKALDTACGSSSCSSGRPIAVPAAIVGGSPNPRPPGTAYNKIISGGFRGGASRMCRNSRMSKLKKAETCSPRLL